MWFNPEGLVGEVLDGRYRLAGFLGEGSFGWVYSAEELVAGEAIGTCAVKLLRPKNPEQGRLPLKEFAAAARLSHPGLVSFRGAFDVQRGPCAGALCLAMELCEGTLRDLLEDRLRVGRRLQPDEVLGAARDLAEVLAWLHEQGAVHRDVKPANLFRAGNRWKLGDLGLLRGVEGSLVKASGIRGTPLYMGPEVVDDLVGPSVDVWALGVLLQECLTGVLAYDASSEAALVKVLMDREPRIASNLPAPFDAVVRGCLVKDPRKRWTAAQALEVLDGSSPASARPSVASVPRSAAAAPAPAPAPPDSGATSLVDDLDRLLSRSRRPPATPAAGGLLDDLDRLLNGGRAAEGHTTPASRPPSPPGLRADLQSHLERRFPGR